MPRAPGGRRGIGGAERLLELVAEGRAEGDRARGAGDEGRAAAQELAVEDEVEDEAVEGHARAHVRLEVLERRAREVVRLAGAARGLVRLRLAVGADGALVVG